MFKILVVEDDYLIQELIRKNLEQRGYNVTLANNGKQAISLINSNTYNIIISDIMMPIVDGTELVKTIKEDFHNLPIIMLTALESIDDKKKAYLAGCDDYLVKPINFDELDLRIRAVLKRYNQVSDPIVKFGNVSLDFSKKEVKVDNQVIEVARKEFLILFLLLNQPNTIFSRNQIFDEVWGSESESYDRTVDVHITKLRDKLSNSNINIKVIRGLGYKVELK